MLLCMFSETDVSLASVHWIVVSVKELLLTFAAPFPPPCLPVLPPYIMVFSLEQGPVIFIYILESTINIDATVVVVVVVVGLGFSKKE